MNRAAVTLSHGDHVGEPGALSPQEVRRQAAEWYERQLEIIATAHGPSWPAHKDWIEAYLRQEIRDRLTQLGWRPKR